MAVELEPWRRSRASALSEPTARDATKPDLPRRAYGGILFRAVKNSLGDHITDSAAAVAYYLFLAIPAMLLVAVGLFSLFAGRHAVETVVAKVGTVAPPQAVLLLEGELRRTVEGRGGLAMIVVGGALAVWTTTGAMGAVMRALNTAYRCGETRDIVRRRLIALVLVILTLVALALVFGLLILGPKLSTWLGSTLGMQSVLGWIWWTAQWPILLVGLLLAFAVILFLGPDRERAAWQFASFGAVVAVAVWLLTSGGFALYVSRFGSYNKTWGSLAAAIILLTWLWLSALSLLLAAEVNAELERTRSRAGRCVPHARLSYLQQSIASEEERWRP